MVQDVGSLSERIGSVCRGLKIVEALPIHLFRHFCCRMYRLAAMRSVRDRQTDARRTDRRQYDANRLVKRHVTQTHL